MEVLILTGNLPYPPTDGWKIRVFSLVRYLARKHRVSVLSFIRTTEDKHITDALRTYCADVRVIPRDPSYSPWKLFRGLVSSVPFPMINYWDKRMADLTIEMLKERRFDIIQPESLDMAQYCLGLPHTTILDLHNIESLLMKRYAEREPNLLKRMYAKVTWARLTAYEQEVCKRFTCCLTCSDEDRRLLREQAAVERVRVIPNGVDPEAYAPDGIAPTINNRLVFVGRMDYHANVDGVRWFCKEILPYICVKRPDVVFQIVGGYPTEEVRRLAKPGQVEVTGFVEDVRPYLRAATAVVIPLRVGGGTRLKILESLAMGKGVVSTSLGAEGIAIVSGRDILIGDHPRQFADQVIKMLESAELRTHLGLAGRHLVEERYSWSSIGQRLEQVYEECTRVLPKRMPTVHPVVS